MRSGVLTGAMTIADYTIPVCTLSHIISQSYNLYILNKWLTNEQASRGCNMQAALCHHIIGHVTIRLSRETISYAPSTTSVSKVAVGPPNKTSHQVGRMQLTTAEPEIHVLLKWNSVHLV